MCVRSIVQPTLHMYSPWACGRQITRYCPTTAHTDSQSLGTDERTIRKTASGFAQMQVVFKREESSIYDSTAAPEVPEYSFFFFLFFFERTSRQPCGYDT